MPLGIFWNPKGGKEIWSWYVLYTQKLAAWRPVSKGKGIGKVSSGHSEEWLSTPKGQPLPCTA